MTTPTRIVHTTAPKCSRRKKPAKPLTGPTIVQARSKPDQGDKTEIVTLPAEPAPAPARSRIVQARKPSSSPYPTLNVAKREPDPESEAKVKAFFRKMMPGHPMND
jgi:hypothetical protein